MKKFAAFSLIELLIVISIIGLLLGIVTPTFRGYQAQKRLLFSQDLLETEIQKAFSLARSEPRIFGVMGSDNANTYTAFSCEYAENATCASGTNGYQEEFLSFEPGIENLNNFFIQFIPPHGDIDSARSTLPQYDIITLQSEEGDKKAQLKINQKSGLIEKIYE